MNPTASYLKFTPEIRINRQTNFPGCLGAEGGTAERGKRETHTQLLLKNSIWKSTKRQNKAICINKPLHRNVYNNLPHRGITNQLVCPVEQFIFLMNRHNFFQSFAPEWCALAAFLCLQTRPVTHPRVPSLPQMWHFPWGWAEFRARISCGLM